MRMGLTRYGARPASVFLLVFLLHPCTAGFGKNIAKNKASRTYDDAVGYELLSRVLENEAAVLKLDKVEILGHSAGQPLCKKFPEEFQSAAEDMAKKSEMRQRFQRKFSLSHPYQLMYGRGSGIFEISAAGFDVSRTHAAVHVFRSCGALCGGGSTYLFRKTERGWQLATQFCEEAS